MIYNFEKHLIKSAKSGDFAERGGYAGTVARKNLDKTGEAAIIIIESKNGKNIIKFSDLEKEA